MGIDSKADTGFAILHILNPDSAAFVATEVLQLLDRSLGEVPEHHIVAVEDQQTVFCHAFQNFQLGLADTLNGAQMLNVHGADVHDDGNIGGANGRQVSHFPKMVHTHFQHGHFRILGHGQDGHGHADVVVVIDGGLVDLVGTCQHRGHPFLGGALAHGTGDGNYLAANALALLAGNVTQSDPGIIHNDGGEIAHLPAAQGCRGTLLHSVGDEIMAIPGTLEHNEQLTGLDQTGIIVGTEKFNIFVLRVDPAAAPSSRLFQSQFSHKRLPQFCRYFATSSRSSR